MTFQKYILVFHKVYDKTFTALIWILANLGRTAHGPSQARALPPYNLGRQNPYQGRKDYYHIPRLNLCVTLWEKAPPRTCNIFPVSRPGPAVVPCPNFAQIWHSFERLMMRVAIRTRSFVNNSARDSQIERRLRCSPHGQIRRSEKKFQYKTGCFF